MEYLIENIRDIIDTSYNTFLKLFKDIDNDILMRVLYLRPYLKDDIINFILNNNLDIFKKILNNDSILDIIYKKLIKRFDKLKITKLCTCKNKTYLITSKNTHKTECDIYIFGEILNEFINIMDRKEQPFNEFLSEVFIIYSFIFTVDQYLINKIV
jgi:hypothetical protein